MNEAEGPFSNGKEKARRLSCVHAEEEFSSKSSLEDHKYLPYFGPTVYTYSHIFALEGGQWEAGGHVGVFFPAVSYSLPPLLLRLPLLWKASTEGGGGGYMPLTTSVTYIMADRRR